MKQKLFLQIEQLNQYQQRRLLQQFLIKKETNKYKSFTMKNTVWRCSTTLTISMFIFDWLWATLCGNFDCQSKQNYHCEKSKFFALPVWVLSDGCNNGASVMEKWKLRKQLEKPECMWEMSKNKVTKVWSKMRSKHVVVWLSQNNANWRRNNIGIINIFDTLSWTV